MMLEYTSLTAMSTKTTSDMSRYRAIMTQTDREHIQGYDNPSPSQVDQSVYRVRLRINEELMKDIDVLSEHRPDLLRELRDVVCDE